MRGHFPNNPRPPLVLAFGFTAVLALSGGRLNSLRSNTPDHYPDKAPLLVSTKGKNNRQGLRKVLSRCHYSYLKLRLAKPLCAAEHRKSVWIKHGECLSEASFRRVPN